MGLDPAENGEQSLDGLLRWQYSEAADDAFLSASMEAQIPLIHTGEAPIGWMQAEGWQGMYAFLLGYQKLTDAFDMEDVYTLRFLQEVYGGE